jgi:hypothetical protein
MPERRTIQKKKDNNPDQMLQRIKALRNQE